MTREISSHETIRTIEEIIEVPEHEQRKGESSTFRHACQQLEDDGHRQCWVCGTMDDLQAHHLLAEWSLEHDIDFDKLRIACLAFDPYGYSAKMGDAPISTVDDIRNLLYLCRLHHEESVTGIHCTTFPAWISQKVIRADVETVPQDHNAIEKLLAEKE